MRRNDRDVTTAIQVSNRPLLLRNFGSVAHNVPFSSSLFNSSASDGPATAGRGGGGDVFRASDRGNVIEMRYYRGIISHLHMNLTASGSWTVDWNFTLNVSVLPGRNGCRSSSLCCSDTCKSELALASVIESVMRKRTSFEPPLAPNICKRKSK